MVIKAVLLDADGVVQRTQPGFKDALGRLCGDTGGSADQTDAFLADVFRAEGPCLTGDGCFETALAEVLRNWQSPATVAEAVKVWEMIDPSERVLEIVSQLRNNGTVVALATNQQRMRARIMTEQLGYGTHFDALLYSCDLGAAKPDPEYFSRACERISIAAEESLFIDDHSTNVIAARNAGLRAEVFELSMGATELERVIAGYGLLP